MTITVYTFEDKDGKEFGSFRTQDYRAAKEYAARARLKVIANTLEWSESEEVDDYTDSDEEADKESAESDNKG